MKTIKLWCKRSGNKEPLRPFYAAENDHTIVAYTVAADVDLEKLTPAARFIAERIYATVHSGKNVRCYSRQSQIELLREEGKSEDYISKIVKVYGHNGQLDQPYCDWAFSIYNHAQTPEEFLNEQAAWIEEISTHMKIDKEIYTFQQ